MTSLADRLAKASKAGELQTLSEPRQDDPIVPLLRKMRDYLADPAHWTKRWMFGRTRTECAAVERDLEHGFAVSPDCPACLLGACFLVSGSPLSCRDEKKLATALGFPGTYALTLWNDSPYTTHADILACLDQAIDRLSVAR